MRGSVGVRGGVSYYEGQDGIVSVSLASRPYFSAHIIVQSRRNFKRDCTIIGADMRD